MRALLWSGSFLPICVVSKFTDTLIVFYEGRTISTPHLTRLPCCGCQLNGDGWGHGRHSNPVSLVKNKVMILNGPAFFGWHRPIVLQGFSGFHTPPSVSNARKMFNWAVWPFFSHFYPFALCHECSWEQRALSTTQTLLQRFKWPGLLPIVENSQLVGSNNRSISRHTSSLLTHLTLKVPFKVAGLHFTWGPWRLVFIQRVYVSQAPPLKKKNISRISLLQRCRVHKIKHVL